MKTLLLKSKSILLALTFLTFTFCSSDDDILAPSFTYSTTILDATFFQEGNSDAPNINWNGNQGSFSLANPIQGISIDEKTGILDWTSDLNIGIYDVQIFAKNSAGQTTSNLSINNRLQGDFEGSILIVQGEEVDFALEFNVDGSLVAYFDNGESKEKESGTWTNDGTEVKAVIMNDAEIVFSGTISLDENKAYYMGDVVANKISYSFKSVSYKTVGN